MNDRLERYLVIMMLVLVALLILWAAGSQLALQAYAATTAERATVSARASAVAATLTAYP